MKENITQYGARSDAQRCREYMIQAGRFQLGAGGTFFQIQNCSQVHTLYLMHGQVYTLTAAVLPHIKANGAITPATFFHSAAEFLALKHESLYSDIHPIPRCLYTELR